ncbi:hypothetical protein ACJW30_03G158500 [Castanea mollissima]
MSLPHRPPCVPVAQNIKVDHHPGGGHWFAAGLSPNSWIEVSTETQGDELTNAENQGFKSKTLEFQTMVLANTVEAVEAVANILVRAGFTVTVTVRMSPWSGGSI